ncbi:hypothetical protein M514_11636 [Trichuris suis]|uniref:Uncharacterized protein n=1 Tax=Trichuris suis TaxID=68888 RepID=A0A085N3A5_9BILA|nr:hypothetical protein M513_11636 [Trichuris suis]KFD63951.1 hypothetical protein M514_11636 [Trichuris suis]
MISMWTCWKRARGGPKSPVEATVCRETLVRGTVGRCVPRRSNPFASEATQSALIPGEPRPWCQDG